MDLVKLLVWTFFIDWSSTPKASLEGFVNGLYVQLVGRDACCYETEVKLGHKLKMKGIAQFRQCD